MLAAVDRDAETRFVVGAVEQQRLRDRIGDHHARCGFRAVIGEGERDAHPVARYDDVRREVCLRRGLSVCGRDRFFEFDLAGQRACVLRQRRRGADRQKRCRRQNAPLLARHRFLPWILAGIFGASGRAGIAFLHQGIEGRIDADLPPYGNRIAAQVRQPLIGAEIARFGRATRGLAAGAAFGVDPCLVAFACRDDLALELMALRRRERERTEPLDRGRACEKRRHAHVTRRHGTEKGSGKQDRQEARMFGVDHAPPLAPSQ